MPIYFHSEDVQIPNFDKKVIQNWIEQCISINGREVGTVNYIFCSDEYLLGINQKYLGHDYYTDIVTFDNSFEDSDQIDADIFISVERVIDNAKSLNKPFLNELNRVIVHGVLHLLGWNDETDEARKKMRQEEDNQLKMLEL